MGADVGPARGPRSATVAAGLLLACSTAGCIYPVLVTKEGRDPVTGRPFKKTEVEWVIRGGSGGGSTDCWTNDRNGQCYKSREDCHAATSHILGKTECRR